MVSTRGVFCLRRAGRNCSPYCRTITASRFEEDADAAALVDKRALGDNSSDDILGGQYPCHVAATLTRRFASNAIVSVKLF